MGYANMKINYILDYLNKARDHAIKLHAKTLPTKKQEEMVRVGKNYIKKAIEKFKELQRDIPINV